VLSTKYDLDALQKYDPIATPESSLGYFLKLSLSVPNAGVPKRLQDVSASSMLDEFEHVHTQFAAINDQLRDMTSEIVVIHRRMEGREE
jgi:hypothetical protein